MKKIIFFIIFTITIHSLWSQVHFVKRFQFSHDSIRIDITPRNIAITDSGYYAVGGYYNYTDSVPKLKIGIFNFNNLGNFQFLKTYGDTTFNYGPQKSVQNLKKSKDGNFLYLALGHTTNYDSTFQIVFKFSLVFDTIWTLTFNNLTWLAAYDLDEDNEGNLIFTGPTGFLDNGDTVTIPHLGVLKLDTLGNYIWRHGYDTVYGSGEFIWVDSTNNNYWVGGKINNHPGIYELDEDGNLLWLHEFPSDFYMQTAAMNLLILPQPYGILATGARLWAQLDHVSYSSIIKNHNLEKEWYYAPGLSNTHDAASVKTISVDNNILISEGGYMMHYADTVVPITTSYQYVYKTTLDGMVKWRRKLFDMFDYTTFNYYPSLLDLETTPDGGFVGNGWGSDSVYFGILAKFDSLGCNGYYSCADTAMVLNLLSPIDSVCLNDTLWMNFHLDGLSAPYTLYSSTGDTISGIYHTMSPTVFSSSTLTDSTQYVSYDIYQQYGFVPPDTNTGTYHLTITLEGSYGRRLSHTYDIPVKNCSTGVVEPDFAQLNIFPNPATGGVVNIEATLNEPAFLSLYDNTGKSIQTMRLEPGTHMYQIKQQLPEGIYFVSIWNEQGSVVKKLLITD